MRVKQGIRSSIRRLGFEVTRVQPPVDEMPLDFDAAAIETIHAVRKFTMTPDTRVFALCEAVRHIVRYSVPGAVVECGVWRGGSMMAAARTLIELGAADRDLFLFDTFEGMSAPTAHDRMHDGTDAEQLLLDEQSEYWCRAGIEDVRANVASTGYPGNHLNYVIGRVEETVPKGAPQQIALLRLDTDWYESTKHELEHLYPRVAPGGIVIIDDYGYWRGSRQATDEFLNELAETLFLHRIDYSGRLLVKPI